MNFGIWAILAIVLLCSPAARGEKVKRGKSCSRDIVCVHTEQTKGKVRVFVENLADFPVTVKLDFTLKNMVVMTYQPLIGSYPGKSRVEAFRVRQIDKQKAWSWKYKFYWQRGELGVRHDDDYVYRLPFATGSRHKLTQGFNGRFSHQEDNQYGLDFQMPVGTKIYAAREGTVVGVKQSSNAGCGQSKCRNQGNFVAIRHADGTLGEYFHLKHNGALVEVGERVDKGQAIGLSGNTGWSSKPHLHFSVHSGTRGKVRQSHPLLIKTEWGVLENPRDGKFYTAVK